MKAWKQVRQFHRGRKDALAADQKGFTLLEVLIAMIILAIIAIPICRVYVSAAQTNAKARKQASATAVAENTMEGINAFSYEDVVRQFDPAVTPDGEFLICQNAGARHEYVSMDEDGRVVYALENIGEDVYHFDAKVTIDPSVYARADDADAPKVNDYELVAMSGYDSAKDYLYVLPENTLQSAFGLTYETVRDQVCRKIQITVTKEGTGDDEGVIVSMAIGYSLDPASISLEPYGAQRFAGEDALRSIYLCYIPNYAACPGLGTGKDQIEIINEDNVAFDLYLVKQSYSETTKPSDYDQRERRYAPEITLKEGRWEQEDQGSYAGIYHNFGTNLAADDAHSSIEPAYQTAEYHYIYKSYESGSVTDVHGKITDSAVAQDLRIGSSAVRTEKKFRMFLVTVEVYEAGAYAEGFDGSTKSRVAVLSNQ
ncbi:MAG: prepilin-type N-terminal cleavage/methylation domain-containing protein [Clostridium sp.]|nr:prepilin-type N-terminal cleavage/methylation domain-containing protein [Clostridium sp.]